MHVVKLSGIQEQTHDRQAGQGKVNVWELCRNLAWGSITLPSVHEAGLLGEVLSWLLAPT